MSGPSVIKIAVKNVIPMASYLPSIQYAIRWPKNAWPRFNNETNESMMTTYIEHALDDIFR